MIPWISFNQSDASFHSQAAITVQTGQIVELIQNLFPGQKVDEMVAAFGISLLNQIHDAGHESNSKTDIPVKPENRAEYKLTISIRYSTMIAFRRIGYSFARPMVSKVGCATAHTAMWHTMQRKLQPGRGKAR